MYKACVFDLDGTLADTLTTIAYFGNYTLKHFGYPEAKVDDYKYFAGNGYKKLVERALKSVGCYSEERFEEISRFYFELYDKNPLYLTKPFDGIIKMLSDMEKRGIKTAVISNKPHDATVNVVKEIFKEHEFSYILGGGTDLPLKPDPTSLNKVLEILGAAKDEAIYVGDTATDMQTGKNAEVLTIGVLWGFRTEKELKDGGADKIVAHPKEITSFLNS